MTTSPVKNASGWNTSPMLMSIAPIAKNTTPTQDRMASLYGLFGAAVS